MCACVYVCVRKNAHTLKNSGIHKLYGPRNFTIKSVYIENRIKYYRTEFHISLEISDTTPLAAHQEHFYFMHHIL